MVEVRKVAWIEGIEAVEGKIKEKVDFLEKEPKE